jgi:hypothetical protein
VKNHINVPRLPLLVRYEQAFGAKAASNFDWIDTEAPEPYWAADDEIQASANEQDIGAQCQAGQFHASPEGGVMARARDRGNG